MKEEAEKYQKTLQELADREIQEKLFKLFHAEQDIEHAERELKERQVELSDLVRRHHYTVTLTPPPPTRCYT